MKQMYLSRHRCLKFARAMNTCESQIGWTRYRSLVFVYVWCIFCWSWHAEKKQTKMWRKKVFTLCWKVQVLVIFMLHRLPGVEKNEVCLLAEFYVNCKHGLHWLIYFKLC